MPFRFEVFIFNNLDYGSKISYFIKEKHECMILKRQYSVIFIKNYSFFNTAPS
jgi:hypothetical protein